MHGQIFSRSTIVSATRPLHQADPGLAGVFVGTVYILKRPGESLLDLTCTLHWSSLLSPYHPISLHAAVEINVWDRGMSELRQSRSCSLMVILRPTTSSVRHGRHGALLHRHTHLPLKSKYRINASDKVLTNSKRGLQACSNVCSEDYHIATSDGAGSWTS